MYSLNKTLITAPVNPVALAIGLVFRGGPKAGLVPLYILFLVKGSSLLGDGERSRHDWLRNNMVYHRE